MGGWGVDDFGRTEPADIDSEPGGAFAAGVLVDDVGIDVARNIAQVGDLRIGELDGAVAMDELGFAISNEADGLGEGDEEGRFSGIFALTVDIPAAADVTGVSQDALLVIEAA